MLGSVMKAEINANLFHKGNSDPTNELFLFVFSFNFSSDRLFFTK